MSPATVLVQLARVCVSTLSFREFSPSPWWSLLCRHPYVEGKQPWCWVPGASPRGDSLACSLTLLGTLFPISFLSLETNRVNWLRAWDLKRNSLGLAPGTILINPMTWGQVIQPFVCIWIIIPFLICLSFLIYLSLSAIPIVSFPRRSNEIIIVKAHTMPDIW